MAELIAKAQLANARLILSGDIRQHGAVGASDALIGICKYAAPRMAEIAGEEAIMRQKVDWYRSAVYAADQGAAATSFKMLEKQGVVIEVDGESRVSAAAALAEDKIKEGSILVLTQTNREVDALNKAIREQKIDLGQLDKSTEIEVETLQAVDLTNAAKQMAGNYQKSSVIVPNQARLPGFRIGDTATFIREGEKGSIFVLVAGKKEVEIKPEDLEKITVCEPANLNLCKGDQLQLKANVSLGKGRKLANGSVLSFEGLDKTGCVTVKDDSGKIHSLGDCRQIKLGYAVTSYSGQGMTVDHVIISDSSNKFATSKKEFYVSISRGRQGISILTSDREALGEHIKSLGDRELAMDMMVEKAEAEAASVPYLVPAVSAEEAATIKAKTPSNVIPFPAPAGLGEGKPAAENVEDVGVVEDKPIAVTEKSIEEVKPIIQAQQPQEHPLDTGQKIQTLLPKVPGFCGIYEGVGQVIQRTSSAVKGASQQMQERVSEIFR